MPVTQMHSVELDERVLVAYYLVGKRKPITDAKIDSSGFSWQPGRHAWATAEAAMRARKSWAPGDLGLRDYESLHAMAAQLDAETIAATEARMLERTQRRLLAAVPEILRSGDDPATMIRRMRGLLSAVDDLRPFAPERVSKTVEAAVERAIDASRRATPTLPMPLDGLQRTLGGWVLGKLYVLGGPTSQHKTTLAHQSFEHLGWQDRTVGYINLEDSTLDLTTRSIARHSRFTIGQLMRGFDMDDVDEAHVRKIGDYIKGRSRSMLVKSERKVKYDRLLEYVRGLAAAGCTWIAIDHLHLVRPNDGRQYDNQHFDELTSDLADTADQLGITIVCCVQLDKTSSVEFAKSTRPPTFHDVKYGSTIAQNAWGAFMVYRVRDELDGARYLVVDAGKHKCSETGLMTFEIDPGHDRIGDEAIEARDKYLAGRLKLG